MARNKLPDALVLLWAMLLRGPMPAKEGRRALRHFGYRPEHAKDAALLLEQPLYATTWQPAPHVDPLALDCSQDAVAHARWRREQAQASVFQRQKLKRIRSGGTAYGGRRKGGVIQK